MAADNVCEMMLAQTEPKDKKRIEKELNVCWTELCDNFGWGKNADEGKGLVLFKIRTMEKRAHNMWHRHSEEKVKWLNKRKHEAENGDMHKILRMWTRIATVATALNSGKKKRRQKGRLRTKI